MLYKFKLDNEKYLMLIEIDAPNLKTAWQHAIQSKKEAKVHGRLKYVKQQTNT